MKRALLLLLFVPAVALAQQRPAAHVSSLRSPLVLAGTMDVVSMVGCSQGSETTTRHGTMTLAVDAQGAARFALETSESSISAPSPYLRGSAGGAMRMGADTRLVLTGAATLTRDVLVVTFDRAEHASVRYQGWGSLPLPPPTTQPYAGTLTCRLATRDAMPDGGTLPVSVSLAECTFTTPPEDLQYWSVSTLVLGAGPGVALSSSDLMDGTDEPPTLRLLP